MNESNSKHRFIVVEGPVGVGKTTLAKRLSESFNTELLLEGADNNPFLNQFYENKKNVAFQTQLFFLFQRAQQMQDLRQEDMFRPVHVADFIMEKDRLFAELTLDEEEFKLYQQIYQHLIIESPVRIPHVTAFRRHGLQSDHYPDPDHCGDRLCRHFCDLDMVITLP